jgi:hypothetical protein
MVLMKKNYWGSLRRKQFVGGSTSIQFKPNFKVLYSSLAKGFSR